jgi:hypothetical protein
LLVWCDFVDRLFPPSERDLTFLTTSPSAAFPKKSIIKLATVENRVYEAAEQVKQKRESFALPARPVWWQAARRAISS